MSLRNLAATIVDVLNRESGSPFPGESLARYWEGAALPHRRLHPVKPLWPRSFRTTSSIRRLRFAQQTWPLGALKAREWSYIRREGDVREELFHIGEDLKEQHNLADDPAARSILEQMRQSLGASDGRAAVAQPV